MLWRRRRFAVEDDSFDVRRRRSCLLYDNERLRPGNDGRLLAERRSLAKRSRFMCCFGRRQCASNDIMRLYLVQCVRVCAPHSARLRRPDVMAVLYAPGRRAVLKAGWSAPLAADSLVVGCRLQPNPARMTPAATPSSSYPRHPIPSRPELDVSSEQPSLSHGNILKSLTLHRRRCIAYLPLVTSHISCRDLYNSVDLWVRYYTVSVRNRSHCHALQRAG